MRKRRKEPAREGQKEEAIVTEAKKYIRRIDMLKNSIMKFIILNGNLNSTMTKNKLQKIHGQH